MYPYYFRTRIRVIRRPPEESYIHFGAPSPLRHLLMQPSGVTRIKHSRGVSRKHNSFIRNILLLDSGIDVTALQNVKQRGACGVQRCFIACGVALSRQLRLQFSPDNLVMGDSKR